MDMDTGLDTKKNFFGYGYRFGYRKMLLWIWIPDWIPKNFFMDMDTGLDTKNFFMDTDTGLDTKNSFYGYGYRIGYRIPKKKFLRIRIPGLDTKKYFMDMDTGFGFTFEYGFVYQMDIKIHTHYGYWYPWMDTSIHSSLYIF